MKSKTIKQAVTALVVLAVVALGVFMFNGGESFNFSGDKTASNVNSQSEYGVTLNVGGTAFRANPQTLKELRRHGLIYKNGALAPMVNLKEDKVFVGFTGNTVVDNELRELQSRSTQL